jgi:transcriptional regulator with XRE-family HTH domain
MQDNIDIFYMVKYLYAEEGNRMLDIERLRMRRLQLRLSQKQLGGHIGHDQGYVSRIERGEVTDITIRTLERLATALRVSTDYLLGRDEKAEDTEQWAAVAS